MSYAAMYQIRPDGEVVQFKRFSNSYFGCMLIWMEFAVKYNLAPRDKASMLLASVDSAQCIWDLAKLPSMPIDEKIVMLATFDHYAIRREDFPSTISAFNNIYDALPNDLKHCHLKSWAETIKCLPDDCMGLAFRHVSVAKNLWTVPDEGEERRPYNVFKDSGHKWLFEEMHKDD